MSAAAILGVGTPPEKLKHHSVERPRPPGTRHQECGQRIGILTGWMDTPDESVTQQKFNGRGEDWLAKVEAAQPMGRTPAKLERRAQRSRETISLPNSFVGFIPGKPL
jgi:hypothetical protein